MFPTVELTLPAWVVEEVGDPGERFDTLDERMDLERSTAAAINYLQVLHDLFGDWTTALAAYNCGEGNVLRAIRQQRVNYLDDFWDLYPRLPLETARYVPRFLAALHIIKDPEKYGYRLLFRSLEEHRTALAAPSWKYTLNYETEWMSREEIALATYEAAFELNRLKAEYGLRSRKRSEQIEKRITTEKEVFHRIDDLLASGDESDREKRIEDLMHRFERVGPHTLCHQHEMKWPVHFLRFNPFRILQGLLARPT